MANLHIGRFKIRFSLVYCWKIAIYMFCLIFKDLTCNTVHYIKHYGIKTVCKRDLKLLVSARKMIIHQAACVAKTDPQFRTVRINSCELVVKKRKNLECIDKLSICVFDWLGWIIIHSRAGWIGERMTPHLCFSDAWFQRYR